MPQVNVKPCIVSYGSLDHFVAVAVGSSYAFATQRYFLEHRHVAHRVDWLLFEKSYEEMLMTLPLTFSERHGLLRRHHCCSRNTKAFLVARKVAIARQGKYIVARLLQQLQDVNLWQRFVNGKHSFSFCYVIQV